MPEDRANTESHFANMDAFLNAHDEEPAPAEPEGEETPAPEEDGKGEETPEEVKPDEEETTEEEVDPVKEAIDKMFPQEEGDKKKPGRPKKEVEVDWESDDNPYKQRHRDTSNNLYRERNRVKALMNEYGVEEGDLDEKQKRMEADYQARMNESVAGAVDLFGEEKVSQLIMSGENSPIYPYIVNDPEFQQKVYNSRLPAITAIREYEKLSFLERWGGSPDKIEAHIRADARAKYEAELKEKMTVVLKEMVEKKERQLKTSVSQARSAGLPEKDKPEEFREPTMEEILKG